MRPYSTQYYTFFRSSHLSKKRCKLNCYPMTGFEHDGIFHKFYVRNWCRRIGCEGRWDETGWDELVDHILGRSASIYLSIYLSIFSLNLNPDWNSMARPTRAFIQPLVPGGATKGNDLYMHTPPPPPPLPTTKKKKGGGEVWTTKKK